MLPLRFPTLLVAIASYLLPFGAVASAQYRPQSADMGPDQLRRIGLEQAWQTHIAVDDARGRIEFVRAHTSFLRKTKVFQIVHATGKEIVTEKQIDPFGRVMGVEGARLEVQDRMDILKARGIEAKVEEIDIPEVTVYVQTSNGTLHAVDGETGATRWVHGLGRHDHPTLEPIANDHYAAVVNGSNVFVVNLETNELEWSHALSSAPAAGPALTDRYVCVPLIGGQLECIEIADPIATPIRISCTGHGIAPATVTPSTISWPTDRGFLYASNLASFGMKFRLATTGPIVSPSTYHAPGRLYVASIDGYVYAIDETDGDIVWRFSAGETIETSPMQIGDHVFVTTLRSGMFAIDANDGSTKWWVAGVRQLLAVTASRVYCYDSTGSLLVLDVNTGGTVSRMMMPRMELLVTNSQTDRLYLGTGRGMIRCLREIGGDWPLVHVADPQVASLVEAPPRRAAELAGSGEPSDADESPSDAETPDEADAAAPMDNAAPAADDAVGPADDFFGDDGFGAPDAPTDPPKPADDGGTDSSGSSDGFDDFFGTDGL
ncbi:MAG: PQQ-binding-like beta-propeller repeat protein [Pirellulaceae bacterium]